MKKTLWLSMVYSGFGKALESWQPASKRWLQAHSQARFVILRVLIEAGDGLISVKEVTGKDGKPDLLLKVDYDKIDSVGRPAVAEFLRKLQVRS
jgi:dipeptidyl-peptidase-3